MFESSRLDKIRPLLKNLKKTQSIFLAMFNLQSVVMDSNCIENTVCKRKCLWHNEKMGLLNAMYYYLHKKKKGKILAIIWHTCILTTIAACIWSMQRIIRSDNWVTRSDKLNIGWQQSCKYTQKCINNTRQRTVQCDTGTGAWFNGFLVQLFCHLSTMIVNMHLGIFILCT